MKPWEIDDEVYFARYDEDHPYACPKFYRSTVEEIHRDSLRVRYGNERADWFFVRREACYPTLQALYDALHAQMDVEYDRLSQPIYKHEER